MQLPDDQEEKRISTVAVWLLGGCLRALTFIMPIDSFTPASEQGNKATHDREWLKAAIAKALTWDLFVVEGVVDAIDAAGPPTLPHHHPTTPHLHPHPHTLVLTLTFLTTPQHTLLYTTICKVLKMEPTSGAPID